MKLSITQLKGIFTAFVLMLVSFPITAQHEPSQIPNATLNLACEDFSWNDVLILVQPYLEETLYTALVMQGQSSSYKSFIAAQIALDNPLPVPIQTILKSIVAAKC